MAWRCHDCFGSPVFCTHCMQECHQTHPFHRVSRWTGKCFIPSSLSNAGLTLNLGHGGSLCPVYHSLLRQTSERPSDTAINDSQHKMVGSGGHPPADGNHLSSSPDALLTAHPVLVPTLPDHQSSPNGGPVPNVRSLQTRICGTAPTPDNTTLPSAPLPRFWEVAGGVPYEATIPVELHSQVLTQQSHDPIPTGMADDPFFANESDDEEAWKNVGEGGLPLKIKRDNRKYDKLHCPILTVVDTTGIHEMRVRFCRCQSLKLNPLQTQLMSMGMYASSSKRTRTVFTFRVLHHFDITNLEGKTTAWQYYCTLQRLTSNVFTDTVADRYRELMRALRQWRDLSNRRRAGQPLDPALELKPGDLALFCAACPQPGINLPEDWEKDTDQLVFSLRTWLPTNIHSYCIDGNIHVLFWATEISNRITLL